MFDRIQHIHFPNVQKVLPAVYGDELSYYELLAKFEDKVNSLITLANELGVDVAWAVDAMKNIADLPEIDAQVQALQETADEIQATLEELPSYSEFTDLSARVTETTVELDNKIPWPTAPFSKYGADGQVLRTNGDGSTQWQAPLIPTDQQAETYINAWLNAHPEATTTVQDGSLTTAKYANDSITDEKLVQSGGVLDRVSELEDALRTTYSLMYLTVFGSVITTNGAIGSTVDITPQPLQGWGYLIFPCYEGQKFILDSDAGSSYRRWCNTDGDYKIVTNSSNQSGEFSETVTALSDGYMILNFNFSTVSYDNCVADIYTAYDIEARNVSRENTEDITSISTAIDTVHNLLNGVTAHQGYNNAGTIEPSSTDYKYYDPVPVKNGVTYVVGPRVRFVCYYNKSMVYVSSASISSSSSVGAQSFTSPIDGYAVVTVYAADYIADKVCMNEGETVLSDIDVKIFRENYAPNDEAMSFITNEIENKILGLEGLKIYNFGDSIAAGDGNSGVGYAEILASMYGCITTDYAIGGTTLSKVTGQGMGCILDAIDGASATLPDIILLEGGANDYTQFRVTGDVTGSTVFTDSSFDETTYIGALELAFYKLQTKYSGVPIIWVYTHRENTRTEKTNPNTGVTVNFTTMHNKSLEACAKWAIPVVDIYNEGGLNTNWASYRVAYTYQGDGTHPNEAGYKKFYIPRIKTKIIEILE